MSNVENRLKQSLRYRGVLGTLAFALLIPLRFVAEHSALQHRLKRRKDARYDRQFGVHTGGQIQLSELDIDHPNREHGERYEAIDPGVFKRILAHLDIEHEEFVFVDLGSGKGRALLLASEYPFKQIVGVELSHELHEVAERNIRSYRSLTQQCRAITSVCMDATTYHMPVENVLLYLGNPFNERVLVAVLDNIERWISSHGKRLFILYAYPRYSRVLDEAPFLARIVTRKWLGIYMGGAVGGRASAS